MNDPEQIETTPAAPFPVPKWARVTAFVGLYALVLAGMNQLEQSVIALLDLAGIDGSPLKALGTMAALHLGIMAMPSLLYTPRTDRNEALYATACSLVTVLVAFVAAAAALIAILGFAPEILATTAGSAGPFIAGLVALVIGALATKIATRRRERMAGEGIVETEESEE